MQIRLAKTHVSQTSRLFAPLRLKCLSLLTYTSLCTYSPSTPKRASHTAYSQQHHRRMPANPADAPLSPLSQPPRFRGVYSARPYIHTHTRTHVCYAHARTRTHLHTSSPCPLCLSLRSLPHSSCLFAAPHCWGMRGECEPHTRFSLPKTENRMKKVPPPVYYFYIINNYVNRNNRIP